ncbi:hypothetical protein IC617_08600 [Neiella sp. HB171785]|uniref:Uncharacterized protein n=1 Tax=Neiella litorisoli TaxID=2771431 RepID=A0A8J6R2T7_9GAMM|nr:hypothetical protein [Neiella litorisoli]MBD1389485.1 hypothetical protein [Neiella litorisoli]
MDTQTGQMTNQQARQSDVREALSATMHRHYQVMCEDMKQVTDVFERLLSFLGSKLPAPQCSEDTSMFEYVVSQAVIAWQEVPHHTSIGERYKTLLRAVLYQLPKILEWEVYVERTDKRFNSDLGPEIEQWDCLCMTLPEFASQFKDKGLSIQYRYVGLSQDVQDLMFRDICMMLSHHIMSRQELRFFNFPQIGKSAVLSFDD